MRLDMIWVVCGIIQFYCHLSCRWDYTTLLPVELSVGLYNFTASWVVCGIIQLYCHLSCLWDYTTLLPFELSVGLYNFTAIWVVCGIIQLYCHLSCLWDYTTLLPFELSVGLYNFTAIWAVCGYIQLCCHLSCLCDYRNLLPAELSVWSYKCTASWVVWCRPGRAKFWVGQAEDLILQVRQLTELKQTKEWERYPNQFRRLYETLLPENLGKHCWEWPAGQTQSEIKLLIQEKQQTTRHHSVLHWWLSHQRPVRVGLHC